MGFENKEAPNATEKAPRDKVDVSRELGKAAVDGSGIKKP